MLPAIFATLPFGQPQVARFPCDVAAQRGRADRADAGYDVQDDVQPDGLVDAWDDEHPLEDLFHRLNAPADGGGIGAEGYFAAHLWCRIDQG
jgi:hypothetical protein